MNESVFNDRDQKIQKDLNEAKMKALEEKYGPFFTYTDPTLPPDVESQWLSNIEEFELQHAQAKMIKVREFLGDPKFLPLDDIPETQLKSELDRAMELLALHSIHLDSVAGASDVELYKFITTEFLNIEMEDIRIEGMMHGFIYEEFHPNDEYDAKMFAELFLDHLFDRSEEYAIRLLVVDEVVDCESSPRAIIELGSVVHDFLSRYSLFTDHAFKCTACSVEGDYANLAYETEWTGLQNGSMASRTHKGMASIRMKRSPYGGFSVIQVDFPGLRVEGNVG